MLPLTGKNSQTYRRLKMFGQESHQSLLNIERTLGYAAEITQTKIILLYLEKILKVSSEFMNLS